jgi:hypothetical protein
MKDDGTNESKKCQRRSGIDWNNALLIEYIEVVVTGLLAENWDRQ